jgi:hypothetical protein
MAFWGCVLKPGQKKPVNIQEADVLHLLQACLHEPKDGKNYLMVDVDGTTYSIACLEKGKREHDCLDLFFDSDKTSFVCKGTSEIHLMGYIEPSDFGEGSESEEPKVVKASSPKMSPKAVVASSPKIVATSPKTSPKAAPIAEEDSDDFEEEGEEEEPMESDDMSLMEEDEEEESESPPPAPKAVTKSPKRSAEAPPASPAKKPKTDGPSAEEKAYVQKLLDHLKANGKSNLGQLGSKVPRPAGLPKMKTVIEANKDKFMIVGDVITAK